MIAKTSKEEILDCIFKSANLFRGVVPRKNAFHCILTLLFFKKLNDDFIEKHKELKRNKCLEYAEDENNYNYYIPREARWDNLLSGNNIAEKLEKNFKLLEFENEQLTDVLTSVDLKTIKESDKSLLKTLIKYLNDLHLGEKRLKNEYILGEIIDKIFDNFSDKQETYSPRKLTNLLVELLDLKPNSKVYDPCCGSGGNLTEAYRYIENKYEDKNIKLFGQEINKEEWAISKLNLFLHNIRKPQISNSDTLKNPAFTTNGALKTFDYVVGVPPWNMSWTEASLDDSYNRFTYGYPPKSSADWLWIQHMLKSLNDEGRMGVILSEGILSSFRTKKFRKKVIEEDLLESIIVLPANLFSYTSIPSCILIFDKDKNENMKDKVYIIDMKNDVSSSNNSDWIRKCKEIYSSKKEIDNQAKLIDVNVLEKNEFNLKPEINLQFTNLLKKTRKTQHDVFSLEEISEIFSVRKVEKNDFENLEDLILIPKFYSEEVDFKLLSEVSLNKYKDRKRIFVCKAKPEKVNPKYLKVFLNSSLGQKQIELLSSGYNIKRLTINQLKKVRIRLPEKDVQNEIVNCKQGLTEIQNKTKNYVEKFKKRPTENYRQTQKTIDKFASLEEMEVYDDLLWPVAFSYKICEKQNSDEFSIFKNYTSLAELIAEFHAIILLSALPKKTYNEERNYIWQKDNFSINELNEIYSFGNWVDTYSRLAKIYRKKTNDDEFSKSISLKSNILQKLCKKDIIQNLYELVKLRNEVTHGGAITSSRKITILQAIRPKITKLIDNVSIFYDYNMIMPKKAGLSENGFFNLKAKVLRSSQEAIFEEVEIEVEKMLIEDRLYIYNRLSGNYLLLEKELIRLIHCPECNRLSMFFADKIKGSKIHYKNYHNDEHNIDTERYNLDYDLDYLFGSKEKFL